MSWCPFEWSDFSWASAGLNVLSTMATIYLPASPKPLLINLYCTRRHTKRCSVSIPGATLQATCSAKERRPSFFAVTYSPAWCRAGSSFCTWTITHASETSVLFPNISALGLRSRCHALWKQAVIAVLPRSLAFLSVLLRLLTCQSSIFSACIHSVFRFVFLRQLEISKMCSNRVSPGRVLAQSFVPYPLCICCRSLQGINSIHSALGKMLDCTKTNTNPP